MDIDNLFENECGQIDVALDASFATDDSYMSGSEDEWAQIELECHVRIISQTISDTCTAEKAW